MRFHRLISAISAVWAIQSIASMAMGQPSSPDKVSQAKAREYLQKAQISLAESHMDFIAAMGRRDISLAQAALGDVQGALKTISQSSSSRGEATAAVASIVARRGDGNLALRIVHDAAADPATATDPGQAALGEAEAMLGDIDGARALAAKIKASDRRAQVLCGIAGAQAREKNLAGARDSFAQAISMLKSSTEKYPRITMSEIALKQAEAGDIAGARKTVDDIADPEERVGGYGRMGTSLAAMGDKKAAKELLDLARKFSGGADDQQAYRLMSLASGYAKLGDLETAKGLLSDARKLIEAIDPASERRPEGLADIATVQHTIGDAAAEKQTMQAAFAAVREMSNPGNRTHAYWVIASSRTSAGDRASAQEALKLAMAGGMDPMETAFQAGGLAGAIARTGGPKSDLSWIEKLNTPEQKGLAYAAAAVGILEGQEKTKK